MKLFNIALLIIYLVIINYAVAELILNAGPVTCEYKSKDINVDYDAKSDVNIVCNGSTCTVSGNGAVASDGKVTINTAGTFILEGSFNGQVNISVTKNDYVHLVLNGISITSNDGPAIYATEADKVTISLIGENSLIDSTNYSNVVDEEPDACLFIDSDLSINGSGSITVTGKYGDAIRCKKDLKIISGNITVPSAVKKGIKAKNSLCIKDGTIDVNSSDTGIKVTRDDDASKGYIVIDGGNIAVSTGKDGIHAETHLTIRGGYIDIKKSKEGLEGQMIDIIGGEIHVLASDDGINASKITDSTESNTNGKQFGGMPGGGNATGTDGSVYINIVGGKTYVTINGNDVDGIDSNGVLYIGGEAEVYNSISSGNIYGNLAALDAEGTNAIVSGATVIATSGNMGGMGGNGKMNNKDNKNNHQGTGESEGQGVQDIPGGSERQGEQGGPGGSERQGEQGNPGGSERQGEQGGPSGSERQSEKGGPGGSGGPGGPGGSGGSGGSGGFGGQGGMNEEGTIYQAYIRTSINSQKAGTQITVKDSNNNVIITYTPNVAYSSLLITSPSMKAGETYTIITGDNSQTYVASEPANGSVNSPSVTSPTDTSVSGDKTSNKTSNKTSDGITIRPNILLFFTILVYIKLFF
ncbi:hypothetical protein PIROE2DRAFT_9173 [Piromyces sp. E2]|nr:hypothetical protein PIROE2DRAFT_9173 [Piromyces sp. E2]|eukprot:OUM64134.1 hypothetical protein PIROE2DRAFT_9173 [Piromyces sp. E2]